MVIPIVFTFFGVALLWGGYSTIKQKRLIENIPTSKIRSVALGMVEVNGKANPSKGVIKTPITSTPCVFHYTLVQQYKQGKKGGKWVKVFDERSTSPIIVDDGTGKVLVDQVNALVDGDLGYELDTRKQALTPEAKKYIETKTKKYSPIFGFQPKYRITENIIKKGQQVYVLGTAISNPEVTNSVKGCEKLLITAEKKFFHISTKPEHKVTAKLRTQAIMFFIFGTIFSSVGLISTIVAIFV